MRRSPPPDFSPAFIGRDLIYFVSVYPSLLIFPFIFPGMYICWLLSEHMVWKKSIVTHKSIYTTEGEMKHGADH